jgi:hypothetical protein
MDHTLIQIRSVDMADGRAQGSPDILRHLRLSAVWTDAVALLFQCSEEMFDGRRVSSQIETTDAQIISSTHKARRQGQRMIVSIDRFLTLTSVGESGAQFVPQLRVLGDRQSEM